MMWRYLRLEEYSELNCYLHMIDMYALPYAALQIHAMFYKSAK